jgi:hypothetical protein
MMIDFLIQKPKARWPGIVVYSQAALVVDFSIFSQQNQ